MDNTIRIIIVGNEIIAGRTVDLNSGYIARALGKIGRRVSQILIAPDDRAYLSSLIRDVMEQGSVLFVVGGLGPTDDDITRFAVSDAVSKELVISARAEKRVMQRFQGTSQSLKRINRVQALIPKGSALLANTCGVAPGFMTRFNGGSIFCLPGVPQELRGMIDESVMPLLSDKYSVRPYTQRRVQVVSMRESAIFARVKKYRMPGVHIGYYPHWGTVTILIEGTKRHAVEQVWKQIQQELQSFIYSVSDERIEDVVGKLLRKKALTLACAESCTGGLLSKRLTDVPGSSAYFMGSFITYSNRLKTQVLQVPQALVRKYGAVSQHVARALVRGVIEKTGTDLGVSVTGIAGPGGGTKQKPVGLVYCGFSVKGKVQVKRYCFNGTREAVRWQATQKVLQYLWHVVR